MKNLKTLPFQVNQKIVELSKADSALKRKHKKEQMASHEKLWIAVHNEYPELDVNGNFRLNCEYQDQGIVMISAEKKGSEIGEILGKMLKDIN